MLKLIFLLIFFRVIHSIEDINMLDDSVNKFFEFPVTPNPECPWTSIVTIRASDDFATQMWEYCTVYAVGRYTGLDPFVPPLIHKKLSLIFYGLTIKSFARIARKCKFNRKDFVFNYSNWKNMEMSLLIPKRAIELNLVLKYFNFIIKQFKLTEIFYDPGKNVIKNALKYHDSDKVIGIYINKADFENLFLVPKAMRFYERGMEYFRNQYGNVTFIALCGTNMICSDIFNEEIDVFVYKYDNIERLDVAILSLCHHVIFKTGGIGLWGGLLCGGEIVYSFCNTIQVNNPGNDTIIQQLVGPKQCSEYNFAIESYVLK